jgi:hypothetical protein
MQVDEASEPGLAVAEVAAKDILSPTKKLVYALLGLVLAYSVVRGLVAASTKLLWYDEIITWAISRQGNWNLILNALSQGTDSHPPLFYLIEYCALQIPVSKEIALRLPSILAFPCTLTCVFVYAKQRAGEVIGLLCAGFLLTTVLFRLYATEARGYSMVVACLAFALVCYQRVPSPRWTMALGLTLAFAESLHYYAVVSVIPFAAAEFVYFVREKTLRWAVWAALMCAFVPLLFTWHFLANLKVYYGQHVWMHYSFSSIPATYDAFLMRDVYILHGAAIGVATAVICGALVIGACFLPPKSVLSKDSNNSGWVEGTLLIALLLVPLTTFAITKIAHTTMVDRYVLPTILGMALALSCIKSAPKWMGMLLFATYGSVLCIHEVFIWQSVNSHLLDNPTGSLQTFVQKGGYPNLPVVVSDGILYLPLEVYASPEWKNRFVYLVDEQKAVQYAGTDSVDKNLVPLRQYVPFAMPDFSDFAPSHPAFLLYVRKPRPEFDWLSRYLRSEGSSMKVVNEDATRTLYLVNMKKDGRE